MHTYRCTQVTVEARGRGPRWERRLTQRQTLTYTTEIESRNTITG